MADDLIHSLDQGVKLSNTLYNARCPVCGDSKKDKSKKRFYIYQKNGSTRSLDDSTILKCYCHNCSASNNITNGVWISTFVRELYPSIYERYRTELIEANNSSNNVKYVNKILKTPQIDATSYGIASIMRNNIINLSFDYPKTILDMTRLDIVLDINPSHNIVKYTLNRKLPISQFKRLYVTNEFKRSMSKIKIFKNRVKKLYDNTQALIMPMFKNNKIIGFQARFLSDSFRFLTLMNPNEEKFFGLEKLDCNIPHYTLEAPLDSLHVNNSIATLDSNLNKSSIIDNDFILVFDNQPRSREICKAMKNVISENKKIVIFDHGNHYKDINDMVKFGFIDNDNVNSYLERNTYQGDQALDKFYEWKKIVI
jgi:hypothetical protein